MPLRPALRTVIVHCLGEYDNVTVERIITVAVPDEIGVDPDDPDEIDDWIHDDASSLGLELTEPTVVSAEGWRIDWTHENRTAPADWTFTIIYRNV